MSAYGEPKLLRKKKREQSEQETESLFEYVARQNGPLEDYHPQMMLQCLLWGTHYLEVDSVSLTDTLNR